LVELDGVHERNQAELLKRSKIWVKRDEIDVQDDEYLWDTLIGCDVFHGDMLLGKVVALEEYGAQDILVVRTDTSAPIQGEWMLPFTEDVIMHVDEDSQRVDVQLLDGMDACFTPKS
jgi:16S rRNA processing protein RimM